MLGKSEFAVSSNSFVKKMIDKQISLCYNKIRIILERVALFRIPE